jgi:prevent-host-death family protein
MIKTIPLADAKKNLSLLIKDIDEKYDRYTITRNGISKAVILSKDEFDGFMETLDILSSKEEKEAIARAKTQVRKRQTVPLKSIKKRYGLK